MIGRTNVAGSAEKAIIYVIANIGDTVTISHGTKSQTKTLESGEYLKFTILEFGVWLVECPDTGYSSTIDVESDGEYTINVTGYTFTIRRDRTSNTTAWTRYDDCADFTVTASIGTSAGSSDFDTCAPFKDMKRVYLTDAGSETTSVTDNCMVKIPKFYYSRTVESNIETITISNVYKEGLTLHPAFYHGGEEQSYIYVGAYETGSGYVSKTGVAPLTATFETYHNNVNAQTKGSGWCMFDISTLSAIQMLYLVEFADNNAQVKIGTGKVSGSAGNTGGGDDIAPTVGSNGKNITGRSSANQNYVVYRGIENLWGNAVHGIDGIYMNSVIGGDHPRPYYICNEPQYYGTDITENHYDMISYSAPGGTSVNWILELGYDSEHPEIMMPSSTASSGSGTTYFCDGSLSPGATPVRLKVYEHGGSTGVSTANYAGMFCQNTNSNYSNREVCARLLYIPVT